MSSLKLSREKVEKLIKSLPEDPENFIYLELLLRLPYGVYIEVIERLEKGEITLGVLNQRLSEVLSSTDFSQFINGELDDKKFLDGNISFSQNLKSGTNSDVLISSILIKLNGNGRLENSQNSLLFTSGTEKREVLRRILESIQTLEVSIIDEIVLSGVNASLLKESIKLKILLRQFVEKRSEFLEWKIQKETKSDDIFTYSKFHLALNQLNEVRKAIEKQINEELLALTSQ